MRRHVVAALAFALLGAALAQAAESGPVGVVDVPQAFQRSPLVLALSVRVGAEFDGRRRELRRRVAELARTRNRLQTAAPEERAGLDEQVRQESLALAAAQEDYRKDLEAAQKKQTEELLARVGEVAVEVARDKGLALLVKTEGVLWTRSDTSTVDITEDVVRALLRKMEPAASPGAPPKER